MPLKGKKLFLVKPSTNLNTSGFQIDYTGESFSSIDAYQKALNDYERKEWTCQCTGKTSLTFRQALESESSTRNMVSAQFPEALYKPVLSSVHQSRETLDVLLARIHELIQKEFFEGEEITIRQKPGYTGTVTAKLIKPRNSSKPSGDTPPSDKENKDADFVYTVRVSKTRSVAKDEETVESEAKIVSNVPAAALKRTSSVTKELLRLFIRCYSRKQQFANSNTPIWLVNDDMLDKYKLKNKIAPLFQSASPSRKDKCNGKEGERMATPKLNGVKNADSSTTSSSDEDIAPPGPQRRLAGQAPSSALAKKQQIKKRLSSQGRAKSSPKPIKGQMSMGQFVRTSSGTPLITLSDSDDDMKVIDTIAKSTPNNMNNIKKKKAMATLSRGPSSLKKSMSHQSPKKKVKPIVRTQSLVAKSEDSEDDKCLAAIAKSPNKINGLSPSKNRGYASQFELQQKRLKSTIAQGEGIMARFGVRHQRWFQFTGVQCKLLNMKQIESIQNEVIREALKSKLLKLQEKEKLKNMTADQIRLYRKEKQAASRIIHMKREDSELQNLSCLPAAQIVRTPEVLSNRYFGEVVMIVEFINAYHQLLADKKTKLITTDELMNAICSGSKGFPVLGQVLVLFLQTLMQDEVAKDYRELRTCLTKIPVDMSTAAELARLCLRRNDSDVIIDDDKSTTPSVGDRVDQVDEVDPILLERLECCEFFELRPSEQLSVLSALVHRLLDSYCINEYQDEKHKEFSVAWRAHHKLLGEKKNVAKINPNRIDKFCQPGDKIKENGSSTPAKGEDESKKIPESPKYTRRESLERDRKKREEEERLAKEKRLEEEQKWKKETEEKAIEDRFKAIDRLYKTSLRLKPLGSDRNHSRYWIFSQGTPGLFVEKGWAPECMDYSVKLDVNKSDCISDIVDSVASGQPQNCEEEETTAPIPGVNEWYFYSNANDIHTLIKALHPMGIRESALKKKLTDMKDILVESVKSLQPDAVNKSEEKEVTEEVSQDDSEKMEEELEEKPDEFMAILKREVLETETEIRDSGFGGVVDLDEWRVRLESSNHIKQVGECMIEGMQGIEKRFLKDLFVFKKSSKKVVAEDADVPPRMSPEITGVDLWVEAVGRCQTVSRMQVLHSILYLGVTWNKSAAKARCLVCRRKGMDGQLLLCDDCFGAYHMYCLRPPLKKIPETDWFCPTCKPKHAPQKSRTDEKEDNEQSESDEEEESEEEIVLSRKPARGKEGRSAKKRAAEAIRRLYTTNGIFNNLADQETASNIHSRKCKNRRDDDYDEGEEEEEEEEEEVVKEVDDVFKQLMDTRIATALQNMGSDVPLTRTNRGRSKKYKHMDLKMVKDQLSSYTSVGQLFEDLLVVVDTAKNHFNDQSRKLSQVEDFETKIGELRSKFTS